ncbi:unnamed protein product, partial [Mesorhabditis belari]|uniref:Anaphase-promoting complex subunit 11 n=1 Tax=Mesorhabditis belari TaxID=2138241 RepID=A0AAF3EN03_9BILA
MADDSTSSTVEDNENSGRGNEEDENDADMNEQEAVFEPLDTNDESMTDSSPLSASEDEMPRSSKMTRSNFRPLRMNATNDENAPIARLPPPVDLPSKTRLGIKIKALHVAAEWKWTAGGDDTCGICQMPFEACCVSCRTPGDDCPLVVGICRHPFHEHCIKKWISGNAPRAQCPMCRQEWRVNSTVKVNL